jgi:nitroreductase
MTTGELDLLFNRRSVARLHEPAPSADELRTIIRAAASAPDHGAMRPWKFIVLRGPAKDAFGDILADAYVARADATGDVVVPAKLEKERTKLGRAPLVLAVAAVRRPSDKIPWADQLGAGFAAAQNAVLAATAIGYGSMWRTGDAAWDANVKRALGLAPDDEIVAFIYLGTPAEGDTQKPHDPDIDDLVEVWTP